MESGSQYRYPILRGREKADVAIVGGGLTGLSAAFWLAKSGFRVALAEAITIGSGSSAYNCGILAPCHQMMYAGISDEKGISAAEKFAQTHIKAIQSIRALSTNPGFSFELQERNGLLAAIKNSETAELNRETETMRKVGLPAENVSFSDVSDPGAAFIKVPYVYRINASRYLMQLACNAERLKAKLFENSRVTAVEVDAVYTESGSIQAPYIVIATGYPIINIPGWYFLRLEQRNIHLYQTEKRHDSDQIIMAADGSYTCIPGETNDLWRINGGLVGTQTGEEGILSSGLRIKKKEDRIAIDTYAPDRIPYIGRYSSKTPNIFVGCGYGGSGLAGSMIAAQAITAQILGLPSAEFDIYSPIHRTISFHDLLRSGRRYANGLFGGIGAPRCSHMGCCLVYQPSSHLWECPCHGSRFDNIGRVVNAPATRPVHLRKRK